MSSRILCRLDWYKFTGVSATLAVSIIRAMTDAEPD